MKKKKVIFIILILLFMLLIGLTNNKNESMSINEVLNTTNYAYLPEQTREFIKQNYEETGIILRTEKNKVANQPYLNPEYSIYLSLSKEEQQKYDVIPDKTIIDYQYSNTKYLWEW